MSASAQILRAMGKPVSGLPAAVQMPLLGWSWVSFNVAVVWFGVTYHHPVLCSVLAGGVDGTVVAVIAVEKASIRFQAGVTGLLGGLSLNQVDNGNIMAKLAEKVHYFVDSIMVALKVAGPEDQTHGEIQGAVLHIVWTAMFVVLASLIAEWVRAAKAEGAAI